MKVMCNWSPKNCLIAIVMLALVTRLAVAVLTSKPDFPRDDNLRPTSHPGVEWTFAYEIGHIAASLAMGNGFSWPEWYIWPQGPTSWMAPVFPFVMAGAFKAFGVFSAQAAIALQVFLTIISTLSCILLYLLGKRLYNAQVGLLAAFLFAIYPTSIQFSVRTLSDISLFICCLLLIILVFLRLADHPNTRVGACLGILVGFTALVN